MSISERIKLIVAILGVCILSAFFLPVLELPFGQRLSYFDLMRGALSGGAWTATRIFLAVAFLVVVAGTILAIYSIFRGKMRT